LQADGPVEVRLVGSTETADLGPFATDLTVVGPVRDVAGQLRQAHVLVLPSVWEGLPTVVLEALACGVPVVSSDLPGVREIARQVTGIELLPVDASPTLWATKVRAVADSDTAEVREAFLSSPFTLDQSVTLWTRHLGGHPQPDPTSTTGNGQ
jgi:glycosyltransferase involved in cell wall biosynthesis